MFACSREGTCVDACVFGSVNLHLLIYPLTLTPTAFQPQSKVELQDALQTCGGVDSMIENDSNNTGTSSDDMHI